jgi:preprotein translocase subunit SecG
LVKATAILGTIFLLNTIFLVKMTSVEDSVITASDPVTQTELPSAEGAE